MTDSIDGEYAISFCICTLLISFSSHGDQGAPVITCPARCTTSLLFILLPSIALSIVSVWYNVWYMKEDHRPYHERIVADPRILAGKPVVKGTRIAVDLVLEELAQNPDISELLAAHPNLTRDDVQACLAYARAIVTGEEVSPKPPKGARSDAAL
jgi:uncharacterized protein (DUF433 family)